MFSPEPQDLQKIKGSYVIHCDRVQKQWPSRHLFTLDIGRTGAPRQPKIVAGVLKLSYFEGTMLVALEEHKNELDEFAPPGDGHDEEEGEDVEDEDEAGHSRKRKTPVTKARGRAKKARPSPRRFSIIFRGRETGTGKINTAIIVGYLEFADKFYTHFKGKVDLPYMHKGVDIGGFKVAADAKRGAEPWDGFSEAAYSHAANSRWGPSFSHPLRCL